MIRAVPISYIAQFREQINDRTSSDTTTNLETDLWIYSLTNQFRPLRGKRTTYERESDR